jgi:hypothetical protein
VHGDLLVVLDDERHEVGERQREGDEKEPELGLPCLAQLLAVELAPEGTHGGSLRGALSGDSPRNEAWLARRLQAAADVLAERRARVVAG